MGVNVTMMPPRQSSVRMRDSSKTAGDGSSSCHTSAAEPEANASIPCWSASNRMMTPLVASSVDSLRGRASAAIA